MASGTRNSDWIWSAEHKRYYYQALDQDGQWATNWDIRTAQELAATPIYTPEPVVSPTYSHPLAAAPTYSSQPAPDPTSSSQSAVTPTYYSQLNSAPIYFLHSYTNNPAQSGHRSDSVYNLDLQVPGRGQDVIGSYSYAPGQQHYESLDPSFYVRPASFFTVGKLIAVLFTGPTSLTVTNYNDSISTTRTSDYTHTQVRRFVLVRAQREFCYACPIFTYGGQATTKPGLQPNEHAIAYSQGRQPTLVDGEEPLINQPICIVDAPSAGPLNLASRICFGIHHPIQYNVKVKDLGNVHADYIQRLRGYWEMVNRDATNQDKEVTAAAEQDDDDSDVEHQPTVKSKLIESPADSSIRGPIPSTLEKASTPDDPSHRNARPVSSLISKKKSKCLEKHLLLEKSDEISMGNWKHIREMLPIALRMVVEYGQENISMACWTCTPDESIPPEDLPLTIAGRPVIVPVMYSVPIRGGVAPPPDPFPDPISPCVNIPDATIQAIFSQFPDATGLYLLVNGLLQIRVSADSDLDWAYENLPVRFGGLKVCYISDASHLLPTYGEPVVTVPLTDFSVLRLGSSVQAKPSGRRSKPKQAKLGVRTKDRKGDIFVTVSTHLITKVLLANRLDFSDVNMKAVEIHTGDGSIQVGVIHHSYDKNAGTFPEGFEFDVSLVKIRDPLFAANVKAPQDTKWLSAEEFDGMRYDTTELCFLEDRSAEEQQAKTIPITRSQCQIVGQGIMRMPCRKISSNRFVPSILLPKVHNQHNALPAWKAAVSRSILYRVSPPFHESGGESGKAICVVGPDCTGPKIIGFQSFAQDSAYVQNYDIGGEELYQKMVRGAVSFYGAFRVPEELKAHEICTE